MKRNVCRAVVLGISLVIIIVAILGWCRNNLKTTTIEKDLDNESIIATVTTTSTTAPIIPTTSVSSTVSIISTIPPLTTANEDIIVALIDEPEPITTTYRVTAYCACEKCCGEWANKRPLDENGQPIVVGAAGVELIGNYSSASPLAFGTKIDLLDYGVVEVQDRTANWIVDKYGENIIDIYMTDHNTALEWGVKYLEGVVIDNDFSRPS